MKTKEELKKNRIPCCKKTRIRLKKYYVNKDFRSYDEAINHMLDNEEGKNGG